uniref:Retrotransposon protein, putative, unclassified n=1 Tax=Meloidogyne hapla TaxID=6305 RepID=A0A1I8AZW0_MELHA
MSAHQNEHVLRKLEGEIVGGKRGKKAVSVSWWEKKIVFVDNKGPCCKPSKIVEWLKLSENRRWATQRPTGLWLDLQDLEFDHHWLFTRAEAAERELVAAYDAWVEVHQQILDLVKKWLTLKEQMGGGIGEEIKEETVIRIGYSCPDELAIFLCCRLLGLKLNSYVLLSSTLSNGPNCAFV